VLLLLVKAGYREIIKKYLSQRKRKTTLFPQEIIVFFLLLRHLDKPVFLDGRKKFNSVENDSFLF